MDVNSREPSQNIIPFRIKGVEIGRFDSSGNLKIGTTTTLAPTVRLDISGGEARVNSGSVTSTALTTTGRIGVNVASPTVSLDVSGAVQITASSIVATALTTRGRIGINTTSPPTSDLDVNGAVIMRSTLNLSNSLTLPTGFWHKSSDNVERLHYISNGNTIFKSGSGFLWYDSNNAVRMFLSSSGLLGIGTTSPTVALDVSGASRMAALSATSTALTTVGRIGVNTASPTVDLEVNGLAKIGNVTIGANPLYAFTAHTFTNAGATGRTGPTLLTVRTTYTNASATWANSYLNMTSDNGIQLWTVPVTGNYSIRARGGMGGGGGVGMDIQLTTTLTKGEVIRILVGQQGASNAFGQGSGGGGTFVVRDTQTPIIVAGGGGGRGYAGLWVNNYASLSTSGNMSSHGGAGGTNGQGGVGSADGGGGGMFGNGSGNGSEGGLSFINGGSGGIGSNDGTQVDGGFGGGGGGNGAEGGGGGGGYSGGGGGAGGGSSLGGGGGGSFGITTLTNYGASNVGHGSVTITLLSPGSSDFDVSGVSRMSALSATATALTTVGRIGVNTAAPQTDLDVNGEGNILTGLTIGSGTNNNFQSPLAQKLSIYHATDARIFLRYGNNYGMLIGTNAVGSFIGNKEMTGELEFYTEQNTPIVFRTNKNVSSTNRLTILGDGKVGIGTSTPQFPLDIVGTTTVDTYYNSYWWGRYSSGNTINAGAAGGNPISMRLNGSVWIESSNSNAGFWATSDRRIKKNINYNISSECLNLFRQLKCSNYSYIDERANKTNVYGYIAQDVSTVIPYAVTTQKGFIPSLYSLAKISKENGIVKITCSEEKTYTFHSLHDNQGKAFINDNNEPASDKDGGRHFKVKLYDVSMNEYIVRINEIIDNGIFTIENDDVSIKLTHEEYFVFGQEVDDYKILNNEAIAMVATAALQEVDRQQQADKARIAELEATVATQQSLINDILERLNKSGL